MIDQLESVCCDRQIVMEKAEQNFAAMHDTPATPEERARMAALKEEYDKLVAEADTLHGVAARMLHSMSQAMSGNSQLVLARTRLANQIRRVAKAQESSDSCNTSESKRLLSTRSSDSTVAVSAMENDDLDSIASTRSSASSLEGTFAADDIIYEIVD